VAALDLKREGTFYAASFVNPRPVSRSLHNNRQIIINLDVVVNLGLKPRLGGLDSTGFPAAQGSVAVTYPAQLPNLLSSAPGYLPEVQDRRLCIQEQ